MSYGVCTWKNGELHVVGEAHDRDIADNLRDDLARNPAYGRLFVARLTTSTETDGGQRR